MAETLQAKIDKVRASINSLEAQRSVLGDDTVNTARAALEQQLVSLEGQLASQSAPSDERRMVTILFIDMVGSTAIAEKLDPEEWRQIVSQMHKTLSQEITGHHGSIAQYLGDGLLAFFGSKLASEHDPENAIRAALAAHAAVSKLQLPEKVQIRAGIHTGMVVVGELGDASHKEFTASGDAMNLAARLQSAAPPGGTLISHDTYRYVRGVFDVTPRPPLIVKGKSEPLQTYLVRRAKARPFRSLSRGVAGIETRTIGREAEMQVLQSAYLGAFEEHSKAWVQLLGDAGVGKSRLLVDMNDWVDLRSETIRLLRARAFPDDANQPFALVRRMWFDRFQIAEDTPLEQAQARWVERFKEFSGLEDFEEPAQALGLLAGLSFEDSIHIKGLRNNPTQVKGRAFVVSRELIEAGRQHTPLVVLLEDMQWIDSASWEYLSEVFLGEIESNHTNGLYILGAARPEWHPPEALSAQFQASSPGGSQDHQWAVKLNVDPLPDQAIRQLAQELLQQAGIIPEQILELLVERSEGIPYYTEEIINWFIDHSILDTHGEQWRFQSEKLRSQPLPATLQHLLLTRLGTLSTSELAALQRGAIFGRRFWTGGVEALGVPSGNETLGQLQQRGFIEAQPESAFLGDFEWRFRHNMLQEVTYESMLKRERSDLHKLGAGWLEEQARQAGRLDEFAGLLGDHCERAGELSIASDWYLHAGEHAFNRGAAHEAAGFYRKALNLLPPADRDRRWQATLGREQALAIAGDAESWKADIDTLLELARAFEDENHLAEATFLLAQFGVRSGDASLIEQASSEAIVIAQRCGNEAVEAKSLSLMGAANIYKGEAHNAIGFVEDALKLARRLEDEHVLAYVLSTAAFFYNDMDASRSYSLRIEQIELSHHLGDRMEEEIGLHNLAYSFVWWGMYKQGRSFIEKSRAISEALGAHRGLAYSLTLLGWVSHDQGDLRNARAMNEQALQKIIPFKDAWATSGIMDNLGKTLIAMGDASGASRRFSEALQISLEHGMAVQACEAQAGLAACAVMLGKLEDARKYASEAWEFLKEFHTTGFNDPIWIYRVCAETFDALGDVDSYRKVLESGYQALMKFAESINVPEWKQSFIENVPDHRVLIEMWERSKQ